jgi:hypothetical protein
MYSGVMMSGLGHEVADGCLGLFHFDGLFRLKFEIRSRDMVELLGVGDIKMYDVVENYL